MSTTREGRAKTAVLAGTVVFAAASWVYLAWVAAQMGDMTSLFAMPMTATWSTVQVLLMALMWAVMMAAMMLPSAIPMVLAYDRLDRGSSREDRGSTVMFVGGYVLAWTLFAVAATGLQWLLARLAVVNSMGVATEPRFAGLLLIAAGAVQFSPTKLRGLRACRTPLGFLMTSWRDGKAGAIAMGLHHGRLCLQCCWSVMLLLFVLGVMNLAWVVVLALFVLAEKTSVHGERIAKLGGIVFLAWGAVLLLG